MVSCCRFLRSALFLFGVFSSLVGIFLVIVVPSGIKSLNLLHSSALNHDEVDHFLQISIIKQKHPLSLGEDITITLEAQNVGKLPLSARKMWLEFMHKQVWISIPDLDPGARHSLKGSLPYPGDGAVSQRDKFVLVGVDGVLCNIIGFYVDIDTFSPGIYSRTSDTYTPELNVLMISHKTSVVRDLLDSVRAFVPQKFAPLSARPGAEELLAGTSLQPMFALQLWEAASVEPLEKNRFYFERLINGSWREHTLYSLDNRLLKRESSKLPTEVHAVLFVITNDAPAEVIRGVNAIWNAAEATNKRPLLLVINGSNPEGSAAKFSVPPCDTLCVSLNRSVHQADVNILRTLHQIILRGESTLQQKRDRSFHNEFSKEGTKTRIGFATILLVALLVMLVSSSRHLYYEVLHCFSSKDNATLPAARDCGKPALDTKKVYTTEQMEPGEEIKKLKEEEELGLWLKRKPEESLLNAQGNFSCSGESKLSTPTKICSNTEPAENSPPGQAENDQETNVIYITLERLVEDKTPEENEQDVDEYDDCEDEADYEETNSDRGNLLELDLAVNPDLESPRDNEAPGDVVNNEKAKEETRPYEDISIEDFEELVVEEGGEGEEGEEREVDEKVERKGVSFVEQQMEDKTKIDEETVESQMGDKAEGTEERGYDNEKDKTEEKAEVVEKSQVEEKAQVVDQAQVTENAHVEEQAGVAEKVEIEKAQEVEDKAQEKVEEKVKEDAGQEVKENATSSARVEEPDQVTRNDAPEPLEQAHLRISH